MATRLVRFIGAFLILCIASGFAVFFVADEELEHISRPRDPWVFAGSLDDRPRVLFVALHHDLWIAIDTEVGDVYKAWRGGLQLASNESGAFSPWPASIEGLTYISRDHKNPWRLIRNGAVSTPKVIYRGYRLSGDRLTISYQLVSEHGYRIDVDESPEVVHHSDGRPGLQREFYIESLPKGVQVAHDVELKTLKERSDVVTDGVLQRTGAKNHSFVWGKTFDISGRLLLTEGAATTLTSYFSPNLLRNLENESALDPLELFKNTKVYQAISTNDESDASRRLMRRQDQVPGVAVKVYGIGESIDSLMQLAPGQLPTSHAIVPNVNLTSKSHFGDLDFYFISHVTGFLNIVTEGDYAFQLLADDGVRFSIDGEVLYEHNGLQAAEPSADIEVFLKPGAYPFSIEHFQSTGRKRLTLNWKPPWRTKFELLEAPTISTRREDKQRFSPGKKHVLRQFPDAFIDLEAIALDGLHPALTIDVAIPSR